MLTVEQKNDIVREAGVIFQHCSLLVLELDDIMAAKKEVERKSLAEIRAGTFGATWAQYLAPLGPLGNMILAIARWVSRLWWKTPSHEEQKQITEDKKMQ